MALSSNGSTDPRGDAGSAGGANREDAPHAMELRDQPQRWPVHRSDDVLRGSAPFAVRRDLVSAPGQEETFWRVVVEHPGAVVVLAVDEQERALVLRQYRHAAGTRFVELPAGLLDRPGEDPLVAARRELMEEGAVEARRWELLTSVHNAPGFSDERVDVFLARELRQLPDRGGFLLEHEEADMTLHWAPVEELLAGVLAHRLTSGPLVTAVLAYALLQGVRPVRPTRAEHGSGEV